LTNVYRNDHIPVLVQSSVLFGVGTAFRRLFFSTTPLGKTFYFTVSKASGKKQYYRIFDKPVKNF